MPFIAALSSIVTIFTQFFLISKQERQLVCSFDLNAAYSRTSSMYASKQTILLSTSCLSGPFVFSSLFSLSGRNSQKFIKPFIPLGMSGPSLRTFCSSCSFRAVIHARVLSKRKQEGKRFSHDVVVKTVYKAGFKLMRREYLWVYSTCCPKLRPYRDYLIMGRKRRIERTVGGKAHFVGNATSEDSLRNSGEHFETRLVVDHMDYWHVWKRKYEVGMSRMANKLKCPNSDRVLRPYVIRDPEKRSAYLKRYRQRRMRAWSRTLHFAGTRNVQ